MFTSCCFYLRYKIRYVSQTYIYINIYMDMLFAAALTHFPQKGQFSPSRDFITHTGKGAEKL